MEVLQADMAALSTNSRKGTSLLDVVGADVNSSFDRAIQVQVVSDTMHLSTGGMQNIGGNTMI